MNKLYLTALYLNGFIYSVNNINKKYDSFVQLNRFIQTTHCLNMKALIYRANMLGHDYRDLIFFEHLSKY